MKSERRMQEYDGNLGTDEPLDARGLPRARVKTGVQGRERDYVFDVDLTVQGAVKIVGLREDGKTAKYSPIFDRGRRVPIGKVLEKPATKGNKMEMILSSDDAVVLVNQLCQALCRKIGYLEDSIRELELSEDD